MGNRSWYSFDAQESKLFEKLLGGVIIIFLILLAITIGLTRKVQKQDEQIDELIHLMLTDSITQNRINFKMGQRFLELEGNAEAAHLLNLEGE